MKTYKINNKLNLQEEAEKIVQKNKNSRKYNYTKQQVMEWLKTLPTKGDEIEIENAQNTGYYSNLFSHWGTWNVGYTYCLNLAKNPKTKEVSISIGVQQTVGRAHYGISPRVA